MAMTLANFNIVEETNVPENTLVLVGSALDGPSHTPFTLDPDFQIEELIGDCPLSTAYNLATYNGITNTILYRINGSHASGTLKYIDGDTQIEVMQFQSVSASDIYNNIVITAGNNRLVVQASDGSIRNYYFFDYPSAGLLADALNLDAAYGLLEFTATVSDPSFQMLWFNEDHTYRVLMENGDSEEELIPIRSTAQDISPVIMSMKDRLQEVLFGLDPEDQSTYTPNSTLGLMRYGIICLVDMFHDDDTDFTMMLSNFCYNKSIYESNGCMGVIGTRPIYLPNPAKLANKKEDLIAKSPVKLTNNSMGSTTAGIADPLSHVQIVVGDTMIASVITETKEPVSLAYSYAASQAALDANTNMTNKRMQGILNISYEFSKEDIANLMANGYISIVSSIRKGYVPYIATNALGVKSDSILKSPHIVRLTHQITNTVVDYLENYIGVNTSPLSRQTMEINLKDIIQTFQDQGKIKSFGLEFQYTGNFSETKVNISFIPQSYVQEVSTSVMMPYQKGVL